MYKEWREKGDKRMRTAERTLKSIKKNESLGTTQEPNKVNIQTEGKQSYMKYNSTCNCVQVLFKSPKKHISEIIFPQELYRLYSCIKFQVLFYVLLFHQSLVLWKCVLLSGSLAFFVFNTSLNLYNVVLKLIWIFCIQFAIIY